MSDEEGKTCDSAAPVYQAAVQHWSHAEQMRWTLLYNYLMASTILLLAWATVFASAVPHSISWPKRIALVVLPTAGFALSTLWVALGLRASSFVEMYADVGMSLEPKIGQDVALTSQGPFVAAAALRARLQGPPSWATSRRVLFWVPFLFVCVYALLVVLSIAEA